METKVQPNCYKLFFDGKSPGVLGDPRRIPSHPRSFRLTSEKDLVNSWKSERRFNWSAHNAPSRERKAIEAGKRNFEALSFPFVFHRLELSSELARGTRTTNGNSGSKPGCSLARETDGDDELLRNKSGLDRRRPDDSLKTYVPPLETRDGKLRIFAIPQVLDKLNSLLDYFVTSLTTREFRAVQGVERRTVVDNSGRKGESEGNELPGLESGNRRRRLSSTEAHNDRAIERWVAVSI